MTGGSKKPSADAPDAEVLVAAARLRQNEIRESIGRLAGGIAHDFNNLFTSILGYAELLDDRLRIRGDVLTERSDLNEIRMAAERARELTQRLLAFSHSVSVQPRLLEVRPILLGMERLLRRFVSARTVLVLNVNQHTGHVVADPTQIEQLLLSLAVNACDAMPDGGTLTIASDCFTIDGGATPPGQLIGASEIEPGSYVQLSVTDTGRGMDAEFVRRVFEPLVTSHTTSHVLGLSAVYRVVAHAGGAVVVDSRPGGGTTIRVLLPRVQHSSNDDLLSPQTHACGGTETILLAEDDADVRMLNVRTLREAGYQVFEAENGNTAIEIASRLGQHIDILITGRNGWEVAESIQAQRPEILVLYVSGFAPTSLTPSYLPESGIPFLAKPFTPSGLLQRVRTLIDTAPQSRE